MKGTAWTAGLSKCPCQSVLVSEQPSVTQACSSMWTHLHSSLKVWGGWSGCFLPVFSDAFVMLEISQFLIYLLVSPLNHTPPLQERTQWLTTKDCYTCPWMVIWRAPVLHRTKWPRAPTLPRDRNEPCPPEGPGRGNAGWTSRSWCCSYLIQIVIDAWDFVLSNRKEIKHFFKVSWILSMQWWFGFLYLKSVGEKLWKSQRRTQWFKRMRTGLIRNDKKNFSFILQ